MTIKLEAGFLLSLLAVFKHQERDDSSDFEVSLEKFIKDIDLTKLSVVSEARASGQQMQEHLYDYIHLSPIKVLLSVSFGFHCPH